MSEAFFQTVPALEDRIAELEGQIEVLEQFRKEVAEIEKICERWAALPTTAFIARSPHPSSQAMGEICKLLEVKR